MGCGDSSQEQHTWSDQTSTTTLKAVTPEEQRIRDAMAGLGEEQQKAIMDAIDFSRTGDFLALSPQHQSQLDTAFNAARNRFITEGKDYADFLSGGRGLRMSDTPIAQQALDRYGLGMADLQGQRALAGLNLGLATNTTRLNSLMGTASALPSGSVFAHNTLFNERLAQPTQRVSGFGNTTMYNNPSLLTQFQQGASAFKDVAQGVSSLYGGGGPLK